MNTQAGGPMSTPAATLYKSDGSQEPLNPAGDTFTLEEVQEAVGGYIEPVRVWVGDRHTLAYCDQDGRLKGLPENPSVSNLVGNVLIIHDMATALS